MNAIKKAQSYKNALRFTILCITLENILVEQEYNVEN